MPKGLAMRNEEEDVSELHRMLYSGRSGLQTKSEPSSTDILSQEEIRREPKPAMSEEEIAQGMKEHEETQRFDTNWPELSSERNRGPGLSEPEEPGKPRGGLNFQMMQEQIRTRRFKNDVEEYGRDMISAQRELAQAIAAEKAGDYKQAAIYVTRVYDKVPDGGMTVDIGPARNSTAQRIAYGGQANEVITVRDPKGNIDYLPVNKETVNGLIEQAKPIFTPREYITMRAKMKAEIKARNADEIEHPLKFEDGHVTIQQFDEKGMQRTEWFANEQDFIDKYKKPGTWVTPEYEKTQADLEYKKTQTLKAGIEPIEGFGPKGRGLTRKEITGLPEGEEVFAAALPRTTEKAPKIIAPSNITEMEIDGKKVSGLLLDNGTFVKTPNLAKVQKGDITPTTIQGMYQDFIKAYDGQFYDKDTGEYAEGAGEKEHREKWVEERVRASLDRKHWRRPKNLSKPQYSEEYEASFAQDQMGEWWPMPNILKPKPKKKFSLDEQAEELGLTKPPKPKGGIKEPPSQTPKGQKVTLPIK